MSLCRSNGAFGSCMLPHFACFASGSLPPNQFKLLFVVIVGPMPAQAQAATCMSWLSREAPSLLSHFQCRGSRFPQQPLLGGADRMTETAHSSLGPWACAPMYGPHHGNDFHGIFGQQEAVNTVAVDRLGHQKISSSVCYRITIIIPYEADARAQRARLLL